MSCWSPRSAAPFAFESIVQSAHSVVPLDVASVLPVVLLGEYDIIVLVARPSRSGRSGSFVCLVRPVPSAEVGRSDTPSSFIDGMTRGQLAPRGTPTGEGRPGMAFPVELMEGATPIVSS